MDKNHLSIINSKLMISANVCSKLGNSIFDIVNKLTISRIFPNSLIYLAWYATAESIVGTVFNLGAGFVVDKVSRKKLLISLEIMSGLICLLGIYSLKIFPTFEVMFGVNILLAVIYTIALPGFNALAKECISNDFMKRHLSNAVVFREIVSVTSPIFAGYLFNSYCLEIVYLLNALTFFFSAIFLRNLIIIDKANVEKKNFVEHLKNGYIFVSCNNLLRDLLIIIALVNFILCSYNISIPYFGNLYNDSQYYYYILFFQSLGAILASMINKRKSLKIEQHLFYLGISMILIYICFLLNTFLILNLVLFMLIGYHLSLFNISFFNSVQTSVPSEYSGRVFSLIFLISTLFIPLGNILFGILINSYIREGLLISGIGLLLVYYIYFKIFK